MPAHEFQYPVRPNVCSLGQRNKALIHHSLLLAAFAKRARDTPSALTNVPQGLHGATYAAALAMTGSLANPKRIAVEGRHLASSHLAFPLGNAPQRSAFLAAGAWGLTSAPKVPSSLAAEDPALHTSSKRGCHHTILRLGAQWDVGGLYSVCLWGTFQCCDPLALILRPITGVSRSPDMRRKQA